MPQYNLALDAIAGALVLFTAAAILLWNYVAYRRERRSRKAKEGEDAKP